MSPQFLRATVLVRRGYRAIQNSKGRECSFRSQPCLRAHLLANTVQSAEVESIEPFGLPSSRARER